MFSLQSELRRSGFTVDLHSERRHLPSSALERHLQLSEATYFE